MNWPVSIWLTWYEVGGAAIRSRSANADSTLGMSCAASLDNVSVTETCWLGDCRIADCKLDWMPTAVDLRSSSGTELNGLLLDSVDDLPSLILATPYPVTTNWAKSYLAVSWIIDLGISSIKVMSSLPLTGVGAYRGISGEARQRAMATRSCWSSFIGLRYG